MTSGNITPIILLGTENEVALPVIRALGTVRTDIFAIHTLSAQAGISDFSKYTHSHYQFQSIDEKELFRELVNRIKKTGAEILLPIDERYVRLISSMKDRLEKFIGLPPLPPPYIFDSLVFKDRLNEFLEEYGFPHAVTRSLKNLDVTRIDEEFFPCLLKPVRGSCGKNIIKIRSRDSLIRCLKQIPCDDYILQEYIPGKDIDCSLLAEDGEIRALTIQKGLESRGLTFSTRIKFEKNSTVLDYVERVISLTDYSGIAHLDFRLDERDGQAKLIDFNARFWLSLLGSKAAGVNFALLSCYAAKNIAFEKPEYREITYMMGRSTLSHYYRKVLKTGAYASSNHTYTDLWGRIRDPMPEIAGYTRFRK